MERLTKTYSDGTHGASDSLPCGENSYDYKNLLIERLGKYEDLEEHGRLIKLPCKVGDRVYQINENFLEPCTVEVIFLADYKDKDGNFCNMAEIHYDRDDCPYVSTEMYFTDIGKTIFLTESEAESKLKELRGGENESSN